jgi:CRP/FNR family cyclic AMP-dependent transcriptional regulator
MSTPHAEIRDMLKRIRLFSELGDDELTQIASIAQRRRHDPHKVIVRQGDVNGDMYYVVKGLLKVTACDSHGREIVMNLLKSGDSFGEIALLDGRARSATVTTIDPCELLEIRRADFFRLLARFPSINTALLMAMAQLVRRLTERAEDNAFLDVRARLAKWLGDLADNHGTPLGPRQVALSVKLSQQELGDMVQATRESVNKCLREWTKEGIIQQNGRQLIIEDRQRLRELASGASG